jgi:hypothetical protein
MTTIPTSPLSSARRQLLAVARRDVAAAMSLAVPFVLCHPAQATVLSDLGDVAARSGSAADLEAFRSGVADLLAAAGSPR